MTGATLPLAKDIEQFNFTGTPINEGLVKDLATGNFAACQRNVVLIGGTGTGKTHLAIRVARALIRGGTRGVGAALGPMALAPPFSMSSTWSTG